MTTYRINATSLEFTKEELAEIKLLKRRGWSAGDIGFRIVAGIATMSLLQIGAMLALRAQFPAWTDSEVKSTVAFITYSLALPYILYRHIKASREAKRMRATFAAVGGAMSIMQEQPSSSSSQLTAEDQNDIARMKYSSPFSWAFVSGSALLIVAFGFQCWTFVAIAAFGFLGAKAWWFPPKKNAVKG